MKSFSLPLDPPLSTADGAITHREGYLVRYEHRGETGLGEATPLSGWTETLADCEQALERALAAGADGRHDAALLELDADEVPAARHGFSTALLDADARSDGVPLYEWLGGDRCETVPVNATVGDGNTTATREAAREAVEAGFDCLKVKVGARPLEADLDRLRAVREACPDVTLRADANGAWDRETASRAIGELVALDVSYVEQPLPADDLSGLASLRGDGLDIAVDESMRDRGLGPLLDAEAADRVVLKPMVLGGPGNAHTLALRARDAGVEPVVTTTIDGALARAAAVHVAAAIPDVAPCGLATADRLTSDLAPDPVPVSGGRASVPQASGLGIDYAEVTP